MVTIAIIVKELVDMESKIFDKLLGKYKKYPEYLIRLHCMNRIFLTSNQIDKIIKIRERSNK